MKIRDKWGNLYLGFMLMSGAEVHLTKEKADAAMDVIKKKYDEDRYQLQIDLTLFRADLRKEDVAMKPTIDSVKRATASGVGGKLQSIWQGYL